MQTIHEEADGDGGSPLAVTALAVPQRAGASAGGSGRASAAAGALRAQTPGADVRPASSLSLSRAHTQSQPRAAAADAGELSLNVTGAKIAKAPLSSILQNVRAAEPTAAEDLNACSGSPSKKMATTNVDDLTRADKEALKQILRRKRARARRQKVTFAGGAGGGEEGSSGDGPGARAPAAIPPPAVYMPAYVPKAKSRAQLRQARMGGDCNDAGACETLLDDEEEFVALTVNKPLTAREPDAAVADQHSSAGADEEALSVSKTELRQRVTFAIRQIRPTVLKHILLRNKLVDGHTQLNLLPKANLVALVMSSNTATRELLRGVYLQNAGGGSLVMDRQGVSSLGKYKKFIELEGTPRPVSDTYNPSVVAGPGLFHRNRFCPGATALERLTWWEREADKIAKEYEQTVSAKDSTGKLPELEGWTNPAEGKGRTFVMFDDRYRMRLIREHSPQKPSTAHDEYTRRSGAIPPLEQAEAMRLAMDAETELSQAIAAANSAKHKFAEARSNVMLGSRPHTSFSMAGQRIDTAIRHVGTRSSWPHASGRLRTAARDDGTHDGGYGIEHDATAHKAFASRPATQNYSFPQRSASVDPEAMSRGQHEDNAQWYDGAMSPLRYRKRDEDRRRGALSPSRFMAGGEFSPEYASKNTFAGGRRALSIKTGPQYEENSYDHLNSLITQKTPKEVRVKEEQPLPPHLLALRNLGTKRWRKAYERGSTEYVPGMAQVKEYLNPRDSRIFDLWGADQQPPPPAAPPVDPPYKEMPKKMMKPRQMYVLVGEPEVRESGLYNFGAVLHPHNNMVRLVLADISGRLHTSLTCSFRNLYP